MFDRPCYDYYKDEYGMLAIDDEKAEVVRKIFDRYLEGESAVGIRKRLEDSHIKSPKGKDSWSKHTIESIPVNMKYIGDVAIIDSSGSGNLFMYENHHTGIISKEKYDAVQLERASRTNVELTKDGVKRKKTKYSSKKYKKLKKTIP